MLDDFISEKILNYISDNRLHTYQEIADETEVHRNTVIKHIRVLSLYHNIVVYHGGNIKGVQLLKSSRVYLTDAEKSKIVEALEKLNDPYISNLIEKFKV